MPIALIKVIPILGKKPDYQIAKEFGCSRQYISKLRKSKGIPAFDPNSHIDWDNQPYGEIPDRELGKKLNCCYSTVRRRRELRKIENYHQRLNKLLTFEKLHELYVVKQMSSYQIGEELGILRSTVYKHLVKYKINIRSRLEAMQTKNAKNRLSASCKKRELNKKITKCFQNESTSSF